MEKVKLIKFIEKFHLGGIIEAVKLTVKDEELKTKFQTEDKTLLGVAACNNMKIKDSEIGIFQTSEFLKVLGAMENEIDFDVNIVDNKPVNIRISDKQLKTTFVLADPDIIPKAAGLKQLPEFEVEIKLDNEFINNFLKSKTALSESKNVAINTLKDEVEFIINYSQINTTRISFKVKAKVNGEINFANFNSDYLKYMFVANKDSITSIMKISSKGLMELSFKDNEYMAKYYLVQLQYS